MSKMSELKPCPFCGSKPDYTEHSASLVVCHTPGCAVKDYLFFTEKWNTRPREDTISAEYDDLLNMYEKDTNALRAENERLHKALDRYADAANWGISDECSSSQDKWLSTNDGYEVARAALGW
jgi:hypothetical protein